MCKYSSDECAFAHGNQELRLPSSFQGSPAALSPPPAKLERSPTPPRALEDNENVLRPWKIPEPKMVTPSKYSSEPMIVTPSFVGSDSKLAAMKLAFTEVEVYARCQRGASGTSPLGTRVPTWDQWDVATAVGEASSDEDGSCYSPKYGSEAGASGLRWNMTGMSMDQNVPLGFNDVAVPDLAQYMMAMDLTVPPGLEEHLGVSSLPWLY